MINKFLIVASKTDPASRNIMMNLMDLARLNYYIIDGNMLDEKNLDMNKINEYDFIIFASKHKSKKKVKTLSIHSPGNWKDADFGGIPKKVTPSSALFNKHLFETLNKNAKEAQLTYDVTLEVTHHGPFIDRPCVFIEVGGSEAEWKDRRATFVVAKTIRDTINTWEENPYRETSVGIGGNHYCKAFNDIQLNSNSAISHIIPKYVSPITEEMILDAVNNTIEEVDFAILDWKGLGKKEDRDKVIDILEKNYISWKKSGEIKK